MVSKMIVDRQRAAARLGAVLDTHAEEASATFTDLLEPFVGDQDPVPDLAHFQRLLQLRLDALANTMVNADEVHVREQEEDQASRDERDAAVAVLKPLVSRFRAVLEAVCGSGTCARLFSISGPTPKDPVVLQRIARRMVDRLSAPGFTLPPLAASGLALDVTVWIGELKPPLERLEASLEHLHREDRQSVDTRFAKVDAMEEYDRAYLATARILEEMFRYVGLKEKAETLRPTRRSAPASEEPEESPQEATVLTLAPPEPPDLFPEIPAPSLPQAETSTATSTAAAPTPTTPPDPGPYLAPAS